VLNLLLQVNVANIILSDYWLHVPNIISVSIYQRTQYYYAFTTISIKTILQIALSLC